MQNSTLTNNNKFALLSYGNSQEQQSFLVSDFITIVCCYVHMIYINQLGYQQQLQYNYFR